MLKRILQRFFGWRCSGGSLGRRSERYAAKYLRRNGYQVLAQNYQTRIGEIDIIAIQKRTRQLVIVEVKSAASESPPPEVHLDYHKQRKLTILGYELIKRFNLTRHGVRLDLIAIVWPGNTKKPTRITHYENAFSATF